MGNKSIIRLLLNPVRIVIPVVLGISTTLFMWFLHKQEFQINSLLLEEIQWGWLLMAILMILIRDLAYMVRIWMLTLGELNWKKCFQVILLWEFASAITPSVVGGTPIAILILNKEGISAGRSTAIALATSFLDELFYVLMVPIIYFSMDDTTLMTYISNSTIFGTEFSVRYIFFSSYGIIAAYSVFIGYGLFVQPQAFNTIVNALFKLPLFNKWQDQAAHFGKDITAASIELRGSGFGFWIKSFIATFCSWTARYWVVNCILLTLIAVDNHLLVYGRQLIMWIVMLVSPTPGGAMFAENAFVFFLKDIIPAGFGSVMAFTWRLISYYPYLFIGGLILPGWLRRVYLKNRRLISFK